MDGSEKNTDNMSKHITERIPQDVTPCGFAQHAHLRAFWRQDKFQHLAPLLAATIALLLGGCAMEETSSRVRNTSRTFTTVVLDPGHGGYDSGARIRKGPLEKDLTLDVVRRLAPKLRDAGFRTIITRKSDVFIPLDTRSEISAPEKNAVFVSVHFNDGGRSPAYGVESYYFSPESKQMANRMVHILAATTGTPDRGARVARFRVLRTNQNPAVLMECGYLSSRREASFITQPQYREKIALALAKGIIEQRGGPLNSYEPAKLHIDTPAY